LDRWYKYVKENKGDMKDICQFALVLAKDNPQKPPTKVKRTREDV
jgi:hypothetical protein